MDSLRRAIEAWASDPTDDKARAYHETWTRLHRSGVSDAVADWFYCCQPRLLWDRLRELGLDDKG